MNPPTLPKWVAPFCCSAPFFALIGLSIAAAFGASVSASAFVSLVLLCGKITGWVLNVRPGLPRIARIEHGK